MTDAGGHLWEIRFQRKSRIIMQIPDKLSREPSQPFLLAFEQNGFILPLFADSTDSGQELERKFIGENIWIIKELCQ